MRSRAHSLVVIGRHQTHPAHQYCPTRRTRQWSSPTPSLSARSDHRFIGFSRGNRKTAGKRRRKRFRTLQFSRRLQFRNATLERRRNGAKPRQFLGHTQTNRICCRKASTSALPRIRGENSFAQHQFKEVLGKQTTMKRPPPSHFNMNGHVAIPVHVLALKLCHARAGRIVASHGHAGNLLHLIRFVVYTDNLLLTPRARAYGVLEGEERAHTDAPLPLIVLPKRSIVHLNFNREGIFVADGDDQRSLSHRKEVHYTSSNYDR